jgi:peptidoglycan/LPS O-acetylase OafA/YrhL
MKDSSLIRQTTVEGQHLDKSGHLDFLDGLRAIAALLVVTHHAWLQSWPYNLYPGMHPVGAVAALTGWLAFGKIAVTAFIVISGYCLMLPLVRSQKELNVRSFFIRRCRRILPPYYAALIITLILDFAFLKQNTRTEYDAGYPITLAGFLSHVFLVQNFTASPFQISGPLWSIAVEFQIYLFFPLFIAIYRKYGIYWTLAFTSVLGYSASLFLSYRGLENSYAHYIAMFGFGMAAADVGFRLRASAKRKAVWVCYLALPAILFIGLGAHRELGSSKLVTDGLVGVFVGAILMIATMVPSGAMAKSFSLRPLPSIGTVSYSLYLIHFPLQQLLWQTIVRPFGWSKPATFVLMSTIGTAVILVGASGFFYLFERPCLRRRFVAQPLTQTNHIARALLTTERSFAATERSRV